MTLRSVTATRRWAADFAKLLKVGDIVYLRGALGSGKTTLAQAIARALGVTDPVTSPTYTLMNEYTGDLRLLHMDLYRLSGSEEFELIGGWEALDGPVVSLIEWPERLGSVNRDPNWILELAIVGNSRTLTCTGPQGIRA